MGGKREEVPRILRGRYALIPFGRTEDLGVAAEVCRGFCLDNGAFSAWRSGKPITDWRPYFELCHEWQYHPRFEFAIIPDVIDGSEADNDELIQQWSKARGVLCRRDTTPSRLNGVPVWHLHESLQRLRRLAVNWPMIALGSSGEFATPGDTAWAERMSEAMAVICIKGRPITRLHGLRMLDPEIVGKYPFWSADSTNVAQNKTRRLSKYDPPSPIQTADLIASRIEAQQSPADWIQPARQLALPIE